MAEVKEYLIKSEFDGTTFNPAKHKYYNADGKVIGSVTQMIHLLGLTNWNFVKEESRDKGTRVHTIAERFFKGTLNEAYVQDDEIGHFDALKNWWGDNEDTLEFVSAEMILSVKSYAGTVDALFKEKATGDYILVDWKTGKKFDETYKLQVEGYAQLLNSVGIYPKEKRIVSIPADGDYKETVVKNEYRDIWKQLLRIIRLKKPREQKRFFASIAIDNIHVMPEDHAKILADMIEKKKQAEENLAKQKELFIADFKDKEGSAVAHISEDKHLRCKYMKPTSTKEFDRKGFLKMAAEHFDSRTFQEIKKLYSQSFRYKPRGGGYRYTVCESSEKINIPIRMLKDKPSDEVADEILSKFEGHGILNYLRKLYGNLYINRHYRLNNKDLKLLLIECIEDARKVVKTVKEGEANA
jgi:hypothetical protein